MNDHQELLQDLRGFAKQMQALHQQAVREYEPIVEGIVRTRSRDTSHIQHTLDGLLDFCGYEPALALFKKLCRYYIEIDPVATFDYVNIYRDQWDSEDEGQDEEEADAPDGGDA